MVYLVLGKRERQGSWEKLFDVKGNEFKAARMVQEYLIKEASELDIEIIESSEVIKEYCTLLAIQTSRVLTLNER